MSTPESLIFSPLHTFTKTSKKPWSHPWLFLSFTTDTQLISKSCIHFFPIISLIGQLLTTFTVNTLIWATIISHLDYFDSLLSCSSCFHLHLLCGLLTCSIQWSFSKSKPDHVTPCSKLSHLTQNNNQVLQCPASHTGRGHHLSAPISHHRWLYSLRSKLHWPPCSQSPCALEEGRGDTWKEWEDNQQSPLHCFRFWEDMKYTSSAFPSIFSLFCSV